MDTDDIEAEYTARDILAHLSHLAIWYSSRRTGEQDVLNDPVKVEEDLYKLSAARRSMRLCRDNPREFTRGEALGLYDRLRQRMASLGQASLLIRPERLVAALRANRTKLRKRRQETVD